jgi:hypothetical protein
MARSSNPTQTASGAKTVSVSNVIPGDILALVDETLAKIAPQPGEFTRKQLLERAGNSEYNLTRFFADHAGKIAKRRVGNTMLYRIK